MTTGKRMDWVDALRGIAMLFVVYGHQVGGDKSAWTEFFVWTSPIKIPLFFIISGFVFTGEKKSIKEFSKHLFYRLVIPWIGLCIIPIICKVPFKGLEFLVESVIEILTGEIAWFMPCLIISQILFYILLKLIKNDYRLGAIAFSITCLGQFLRLHYPMCHIAMVDIALTMQFFLLLGKLMRKHQQWTKTNFILPVLLLFTYCLLAILSSYYYPNRCLDVHQGVYYNYFICLSMILIGNYVLFYFFSHIQKCFKPLILVGTNTLVIYLWHHIFANLVCKVFLILPIVIDFRISGIIITFISTVVCCLLSILITKYIPLLNGSRKR